MLNVINTLFIEVNPIPVKTAMNVLGYEVGGLKLPLCDMEEKNLEILKNSLKEYGLIWQSFAKYKNLFPSQQKSSDGNRRSWHPQ